MKLRFPSLFLLTVAALSFAVRFVSAQQSCDGFPPGSGWTTVEIAPGNHHDLGANASGFLWSVGSNGVELIVVPSSTFCFTQQFPTSLAYPGGQLVTGGAIAVAPDNSVWVRTNNYNIWKLPPPMIDSSGCHWNTGWMEYPGAAHDITVTSDGTTWVTGTNSVGGGWGIWFWNTSINNWQSVQGGAVRIASGTGGARDDGQIWVVNDSNHILHRHADGSWTGYPGLAWDIAVDASGLPVVVGTNQAQGSTAFAMYFFSATCGCWVNDPNIPAPFGGAEITSGVQDGNHCHVAYFIDDVGNIWELTA